MSIATATSTEPAPKRAKRAVAQTDEPGTLPKDLAERGWTLKEHAGDNHDRFQCVNKGSTLTTSAYLTPNEAFEAARRSQEQHDAKAQKQTEPVVLEKMPILVREKRLLPVPLTPAEVDQNLDDWRELDIEKMNLEAERKQSDEAYKGRIAEIAARSAHKQKLLKDRTEEREVETVDRMDYPNALVRMIRLDTGAEYDTRPMTPEELKKSQHRLPSV